MGWLLHLILIEGERNAFLITTGKDNSLGFERNRFSLRRGFGFKRVGGSENLNDCLKPTRKDWSVTRNNLKGKSELTTVLNCKCLTSLEFGTNYSLKS